MSVRIYLALLLAAGHFGVVICAAAYQFPGPQAEPGARPLQWYGELSGARSNFGFFASPVGAPHRARFLVTDERGDTLCDAFEKTGNFEARLRLSGIVDAAFMTGASNDQARRQRIMSSWAANMFSRHPDAVSLTVIVEAWCVPGMADFRVGSRPDWEEVYRAEFQRRLPNDAGTVRR